MQRTHLCTVSLLQNYCPRKRLLQNAVCDSLIISVPFPPLLCLPALHWTSHRIPLRLDLVYLSPLAFAVADI